MVVTLVEIVHHESISRGKDREGAALARHQRESGQLRAKHAGLFAAGDPLTSQRIHPHSNRYQPRARAALERPGGRCRADALEGSELPAQPSTTDRCDGAFFSRQPFSGRPLPLIDEYRRFADVTVVSSASGCAGTHEPCIGCANAVPRS